MFFTSLNRYIYTFTYICVWAIHQPVVLANSLFVHHKCVTPTDKRLHASRLRTQAEAHKSNTI